MHDVRNTVFHNDKRNQGDMVLATNKNYDSIKDGVN